MNTVFLAGTITAITGAKTGSGHHLSLITEPLKKRERSLTHTVLIDAHTYGCSIRSIKIGSVIVVHGQIWQEEKQDVCVIIASHAFAAYQSSKNTNNIEVVGKVIEKPKIYEKKKLAVSSLVVPVRMYSDGRWERKKTHIKVAAWNSVANIIEKYVKRGTVVGINGHLDNGYPNRNLREINSNNIHLY